MTAEEQKAWEVYVGHCKIMAGNPVLYKEMSFIKPVLAADEELTRLRSLAARAEDVENITSIIAQNKKCGETAKAVVAYLKEGK